MLIHTREYGRYVEITGFRGIQIEDPKKIADLVCKKSPNTTLQFLNAQRIATWEHLYFAVLDAMLAFRNKNNISKSLGMEIMLYASASRQIRKAIDLIGVGHGRSDLATVISGEKKATVKQSLSILIQELGQAPDETVLQFSGKKIQEIQRIFGISEIEMKAVSLPNRNEALIKLVIERMALLATQI